MLESFVLVWVDDLAGACPNMAVVIKDTHLTMTQTYQ